MLHQRELEVRAGAGEVVEAGAGDLRAAVDVDRAEDPAELDVVAGLEALGREVAGRADVLEHHEVVLAARRGLVGGRVRDRQHRGAVGLLGLPLGGLGLLHVGRERLGPLEQRLLLLALRLGDLLAELLLLRAEPLVLRDRGPPLARRPPAPRRPRRRRGRAWPGRRGGGRGRRGAGADRSPPQPIDRADPVRPPATSARSSRGRRATSRGRHPQDQLVVAQGAVRPVVRPGPHVVGVRRSSPIAPESSITLWCTRRPVLGVADRDVVVAQHGLDRPAHAAAVQHLDVAALPPQPPTCRASAMPRSPFQACTAIRTAVRPRTPVRGGARQRTASAAASRGRRPGPGTARCRS